MSYPQPFSLEGKTALINGASRGIGLAIARLNKNLLVKLGAPLLGFTMAVFAHALHNTAVPFLTGFGGALVRGAIT